jgi:hypothetical protein
MTSSVIGIKPTQGFLLALCLVEKLLIRKKNRHIRLEKFKDLPRIDELVRMFKAEFPHLDVDSVWLLQKTRCEDGFQTWHRDFALGQKITTTIVVNVGSFKSIH